MSRRQVEELLTAAGPGPVVVHSDLFRTRNLVPTSTDRDRTLSSHLELLKAAAGGRPLWFPTFNYEFTRSGVYDLTESPSEVGPLGEAVRQDRASWRTLEPVFSFAGFDPPPPIRDSIPDLFQAFGEASSFAELERQDGSILLYGASLSSLTSIHRVEFSAGPPPYRYDKRFPGEVVTPDGALQVELDYHVRPKGLSLEYDWPRLEEDLKRCGVLSGSENAVAILDARALSATWQQRLEDDPLYLLNPPTRRRVDGLLQRIGRRFRQADFE